MNFKVTIQEPGAEPKVIEFQSGTVTIQPLASEDSMKVRCLVRPDDWLQVRSNVVSKLGQELTFATIIESDPVRDPNHWLKRTDAQLGGKVRAVLVPDSQAVRNRRHRVRRKKKGIHHA